MVYDIDMLRIFYADFSDRLSAVREKLQRPLTFAEKILYVHLYDAGKVRAYMRGEDYATFRPDRVAMQDATAQMALLQFMNAGRSSVAVPSTVHCDHLIQAHKGVTNDLPVAKEYNAEVYDFLRTVAARYGIGFWQPGAGIIHQVVLENYAFPGGMMVGTDSHTPNAGGLGMVAIGVGGADAVDVMAGMEWELKVPKVIGVHLKGRLHGWASAKDVILKLAGMLTVKGGTNAILEYFGEGVSSLSCTGKATICNMGAEVGATTSLFPFDRTMAEYLRRTGRAEVADMANAVSLCADAEVLENPEKYYDRVIEIDLDTLSPYINGPFTPDAACPVAEMAEKVERDDLPDTVEVALIGSCTNSSYQDLARVASVLRQIREKHLKPKASLIINPGSQRISATLQRDGLMQLFEDCGAVVMTNACGPCIGQWKRITDDSQRRNTIVTSFNRNFAKRADGNPNTHAFVASPEMVAAYFISGSLSFNPITGTLLNEKGEYVKLDMPHGEELPVNGFVDDTTGYTPPTTNAGEVIIREGSERLQRLMPFPEFHIGDYSDMTLLIKVKGKCTTDHISMAGPWLRYRGHLENISRNLLMGAVNTFNSKTNEVVNVLTGEVGTVSDVATYYKQRGISSIVVAEDNYGEGSSREHAAMEPRFLNVKTVLAKSFARIHETNLKKQGILAITFANSSDYDRIRQDDRLSVVGLEDFTPETTLQVRILHSDGQTEAFSVCHTYNQQQIGWLKAGSALNSLSGKKV